MCFSSLDIDFFVRSGLKGIRLFQSVRFLKNLNMKNLCTAVLARKWPFSKNRHTMSCVILFYQKGHTIKPGMPEHRQNSGTSQNCGGITEHQWNTLEYHSKTNLIPAEHPRTMEPQLFKSIEFGNGSRISTKNMSYLNLNISRTKNGRNKV